MSFFLNPAKLFKPLVDRVTTAMDSAKINSIRESSTDGAPCVIKRRLAAGRQLSAIANFYFDIAHIHIRYWNHLGDWRKWEVNCFRMLNSDRFDAVPSRCDTVRLDKIPGESVWAILMRGAITRRVVRLAARELRRAHEFWSDEFHGPWSHGDASMSNFIYDESASRVRLIDFEIVHDRCLSPAARHADDVLVFLLDLAGFAPPRRWLVLALAFLREYDSPEVMIALRRRLVIPSGLARIWWGVRTNFIGAGKIGRRLAELRATIDRGGLLAGDRLMSAASFPATGRPASPGAPRKTATPRVPELRRPTPALA